MSVEEGNAQYSLIGFIAGAHANGNSHFMDEVGIVLCGSKSRLGFDASIEIRFRSIEDFDHDQEGYRNYQGEKLWHKNHLPLRCSITCIRCQQALEKVLRHTTQQTNKD